MRLTVIIALIALACGATVAWKWKAGDVAIAEAMELREHVGELRGVIEQQQLQGVQQIAAFDAAVQRLDAISKGREDDLNHLQNAADALARDLAQLRGAHADLLARDLGPEFLRHWNQAIGTTSPGTAEPAPEPAGESDERVPATSDAAQLERGGGASPARPGGAAVPGLREPAGAAAGGDGRVGGDELALVLPGVAATVAVRAPVRIE